MDGKYRNVSNIAALGVEWVTPDGTTFQLVCPRGTARLTLGIRWSHEEGRWTSLNVDEPERFGLTGPIETYDDFVPVVEKWRSWPLD